jgi:penicillin-binding protein 1C
MLDGRRLGQARRITWAPWPGRHELALLGRDGAVVDTVRFEVRGTGVRATPAAARR